jgi:hypothetical protein
MSPKREIISLPAQIDLPSMEKGILDFWSKNQIFEKSVENRSGANAGVFTKVHQLQMASLVLITLKQEFLRIYFHAFKQ